MHTEKPGRNIKREKREREKKKRLVIAALRRVWCKVMLALGRA